MDAPWIRRAAAYDELLLAALYAEQDPEKAWSFAVKLDLLRELGLSRNDLRWLVCSGNVEHRIEVSQLDELNILPRDQEERTFLPLDSLQGLSHASCFMLTARGIAFFRAQLARAVPGSPDDLLESACQPSCTVSPDDLRRLDVDQRQVPEWNAVKLELKLDDMVVKQFKASAPNQECILAAFQEEGWPFHIDDPLSPIPEVDPKQRLHDTIKRLNGNQLMPLLLFFGDGKGRGICWRLRSHTSAG